MFFYVEDVEYKNELSLDKLTHLYVIGGENTGKTKFIDNILQKVGDHHRIDVTIPLEELSHENVFFTPSLTSRLEGIESDSTPIFVVMSHENLGNHDWLFEGSREIEKLITEGEKVNYYLIIETRKEINLDESLKEKMKVIQL